jgi:hypothetical protein
MSAVDPPGPGPFVCPKCISDSELKVWIRTNAVSRACTFCGRQRKRPIAADADELVGFVETCLAVEYEDAAEMVAVEAGEYLGSWKFTRELLEDEGLEPVNEEAFDYLVEHLPDKAWVPVDYYSLHPRDTLMYGWEHFARAIKHETRYLFFPPRGKEDWVQHDEIRPEDMLAALGRVIRANGLVRVLPKGTRLYRVRPHSPGDSPSTIADLASPPAESVIRASRMSPAGISMLYVAVDPGTAVAETRDAVRDCGAGTLATFELESTARIVDFVRLPPLPGLFTPDVTRSERGMLQFAHAFADEISKPVSRDSVEHIDYVPSQVVTEYLRFRFRSRGRSIHGLRYRSVKREGGKNLALFLKHEHFCGDSDWAEKSPVRLRLLSYERLAPA